jgi:signal transduction histidine kinase/CheY-like chemotaxis protein
MSRKRVGFRWVVAALVLSIVAPLTVLGGIGIERSWTRVLTNLNRQNLATVRAISVAIDSEVQGTTAALTVLGELHAFDTPDLAAFENLATRLLPNQPTWSSIILADAAGTILDGVPDTDDGKTLVGEVPWVPATISRGGTTVSNLFTPHTASGHFVMVSVPVFRNGRPAFVLGARVQSDAFGAILQKQNAPPNGLVGLVDASGTIVARSKDEAQYVGTSITPEFKGFLAQRPEGNVRAQGRDGVFNYASYQRSPRTGLTVALAVPTSEVDGPVRRLAMYLAGGWLLIIGAGAALGFFLGNVIVKSLSGASRAALALARDEEIDPSPSRIAEIDDLATGLRGAAATLKERNRERDEAARIKDEFLMTVSHELRTPLTAIVGWARMLSTGQIRDGQRQHAVVAIERNANALHQLVNDLLDVSRIVSGNLRLEMQPVLLADVVAAAIDSVRPAAEARGIAITADADKQATVRGDAGRLQQIVWNLLSNAVKFTPASGTIVVGIERVGREAIVQVSDSGSGIPAAFLPYVFDRFRQAESGTTRPHGGLGLGLAIVRHLVELHGGTVAVTNNDPAPGCTFTVALPLRSAARGDAALRRITAPGALQRLDNIKLLVVDDDVQTRELFAAILENAGARVRAAASAEDAVTLLATEWPDVLLSDIEMPNQDGYALLRRAREMEPEHGPLPAIAVTAHARPDDQARAIDSGFAWHLAKPVEPAELVKVVASVMQETGTVS